MWLNNYPFGDYLHLICKNEIGVKNTIDTRICFLSWPSLYNGQRRKIIYNYKQNTITNLMTSLFSFICSNIPASPGYSLFTFHNVYVTLSSVQWFLWHSSAANAKDTQNKAALLLGWKNRYRNSTVAITNWLTFTKYPLLKWQWIFRLAYIFFFPISLIQDFYLTGLYERHDKWKGNCLPFAITWIHIRVFGGSICCSSFSIFFFFVFVQYLVYPMLPVSLDCPLLTSPLVFSNIYIY